MLVKGQAQIEVLVMLVEGQAQIETWWPHWKVRFCSNTVALDALSLFILRPSAL